MPVCFRKDAETQSFSLCAFAPLRELMMSTQKAFQNLIPQNRIIIVPKFRLLFWFGLTAFPFGTLALAVPDSAQISLVLLTVLLLLLLSDAILSFKRLSGVRAELPDVLRLSKDREGVIDLRVRNDPMKIRQVKIGLPFPRAIWSQDEIMTRVLPKGHPVSVFSWPCKALKQGKYLLDTCHLETASLLGFWAIRTHVPAHMEIRVYPNLMTERKQLAAFFLKKRHGVHTQRQIGRGRDFEQLREYVPGDCYEDIHWKATARRGYPVTKMYQIERTQDIYLIIDASRLSARKLEGQNQNSETPSADAFTSILDSFATAAVVMGMAAEQQGDRFGVLTFSDRVEGFVRAKNGKFHYNACRDAVYTLQPRQVSPDFAELFTFIGVQLRRRSLLIFLTCLDDPVLSESFSDHVRMICRRHLVLVNMIRPQNAMPLFSGQPAESPDDLYHHLGGHLAWKQLRETENILRRHGVGFSLPDNENLCPRLVSDYLAIKQRQIL